MAKKMNKFAKKAAEMEAWGQLLETAYEQLRWHMETREDENGETILGDDGEPKRFEPEENSYDYARYIGWCEVVKTLEGMKL